MAGPHRRKANHRLVNRNVFTGGHRTSIRMEPEFWTALEELCHRQNITCADFITQIDQQRGSRNEPEARTSAVKVSILQYYRAAATSEGHALAGHGELNAVAA